MCERGGVGGWVREGWDSQKNNAYASTLPKNTGVERIRFFESTRKDLEKEAAKGFEALLAHCERVQQSTTKEYPNIPLVHKVSTLESCTVDHFAQSMM